MDFIKKQAVGFYFAILTLISSCIGLIFYMINTKTAYFVNRGVDNKIVAPLIIAMILLLVFLAGSQVLGSKRILDILPVAATAIFMYSFVSFVAVRVSDIATIMTFENNAKNMADLSSAVVGLVFCFIALLFSIIGSFFKVVKE